MKKFFKRIRDLGKAGGGKYKCQLCGRMIHRENALEHIKAEEYLIELVRKDHPRWNKESATCKECIDYYKKLVDEAEI
ncbi:MAG: hypothetical protein GF375_02250 [Candidatus Omnitrophica bacterium]|nr:hypothetical protein [Candidatus Omnitrophota bacterium]MBD3268936.1 hypothetical protein [Candidatus Omnitrophota bacterium]